MIYFTKIKYFFQEILISYAYFRKCFLHYTLMYRIPGVSLLVQLEVDHWNCTVYVAVQYLQGSKCSCT